MAFLFFTNAAENFEGQSVAINTEMVLSVLERKVEDEKTKKTKTTTVLYAGVNGSWEVSEPFLEVVARLNEQ